MEVWTLAAPSTEMSYITFPSPCYCLVFQGIIYLTHEVQTQTVMLISLMNNKRTHTLKRPGCTRKKQSVTGMR